MPPSRRSQTGPDCNAIPLAPNFNPPTAHGATTEAKSDRLWFRPAAVKDRRTGRTTAVSLQSSRGAGVIASGVIQQHALLHSTGPFPDLAGVKADDRFARSAPVDRTIALYGDAVAPEPRRDERKPPERTRRHLTGGGYQNGDQATSEIPVRAVRGVRELHFSNPLTTPVLSLFGAAAGEIGRKKSPVRAS
jgi:hypothetical protein